MSFILEEQELQIRHVVPGKRGNADFPSYNAPISAKENILRVTRGEKALFMPGYKQYVTFGPRCVPDVEARANARDGGPNVTHPEGFRDMFGVNWKFIDVAGGHPCFP